MIECGLLVRDARRVRLKNLRPGLFFFGDTLCVKSEYSTDGCGDAYIVESGEFLWGGVKTHQERADLLVWPARIQRFA